MKFENKVMPNDDQMAEFLETGNDEPIYMVNLLKFKIKLNIQIKEKQIYREEKLMPFILKRCNII